MHQNHRNIKEQNSRLINVNEKLLSESDSLRKEIFRLRNLFGDDSFLTQRDGQKEVDLQSSSQRPEKNQSIEQQLSLLEIDLRRKNAENENLKRDIQDMDNELNRIKQDNRNLKEKLLSISGGKANPDSANLEAILRENENLKSEVDSMRKKLSSADRELKSQNEKMHFKNQELEALINDFDGFREKYEELEKDVRESKRNSPLQKKDGTDRENSQIQKQLTEITSENEDLHKKLNDALRDVRRWKDSSDSAELNIKNLRNKLQEADDIIFNIESKLKRQEREVDSLNEDLNKSKKIIASREKEIDELIQETRKIRDLHDKLDNVAQLKEDSPQYQEVSLLRAEKTQLNEEIERLRKQLKERSNGGVSSSEIGALRDENRDMKRVIDEQDQQIRILNTDLKKALRSTSPGPALSTSDDKVQIENQRLKEEQSDLLRENKKNNNIIKELNEHINELTLQMAKGTKNITGSPTKESDSIRENEELRKEIEKMSNIIGEKDRKIRELKQEIIRVGSINNEQFENGDSVSNEKEMTIKLLRENNSEMQSLLEAKDNNIQALNGELNKLKNNTQLSSVSEPELVRKVKSLDEQVDQLTKNVATKDNLISSLNDDNNRLSDNVDQLTKQNKDMVDRLTSLTRPLSPESTIKELDSAKAKISNFQTQLEDLKKKLEKKDKESDNLQSENVKLRSTNEDLTNQNQASRRQSINSSNREILDKVTRLENEKIRLDSKIRELNEANEMLTKLAEKKDEKIQSLSEEVNRLDRGKKPVDETSQLLDKITDLTRENMNLRADNDSIKRGGGDRGFDPEKRQPMGLQTSRSSIQPTDLNEQVALLNRENVDLKSQVDDLQKALKNQKISFEEENRAAEENSKRKIRQLSGGSEEMLRDLQEKDDRIKSMQNEINTLMSKSIVGLPKDEAMARLTNSNKQLTDENADLRNKARDLRAENGDLHRDFEAERTKSTEINRELGLVKTNLNQLRENNSEMQSLLEAKDNNIQALNGELNKLKNNTQLSSVSEPELVRKVKSLDEQVDQLTKNVATKDNLISSLNDDNNRLSDNVDQLTKQNKDMVDRLTSLTRPLSPESTIKELDSAKAKISNFQTQLEDLKKKLEKKDKESDNLQSENVKLRSTNEDLTNQNQASRRQSINSSNREILDKVTRLENEKIRLDSKIRELNEANEMLTKLAEKKDEKIQSLSEEVNRLDRGKKPVDETSQLLDKITDLTRENMNLREIIDSLNDPTPNTNLQLTLQHSDLSPSDPTQLLSQISSLTNDNTKLKHQISKLTTRIQNDEIELVEAQSKITDLEDELDTLKNLLSRKDEEITHLNTQLLRKLSSSIRADDQEAFIDLYKQISDLKKINEDLTTNLESSNKKLSRLQLIKGPSISVLEPQSDLPQVPSFDIFDSIKRFDQIKKLIEAKDPQNPPKVETERSQDGSYTIKVEYPPQNNADPPIKKIITIPEHLFTEMKGVSITSNVDPNSGKPQNNKLYRESYSDGQKSTEVISSTPPLSGPTTAIVEKINIPTSVFEFFNIPSESEVKNEVPAFIISKAQDNDLGEDFGLVKYLISPSFASEQLEGTKMVIKREEFKGGKKENEQIIVLPREVVRGKQEKDEDNIMNNLLIELAKREKEENEIKGTIVNKKKGDIILRKTEDPNTGIKRVEKILIPKDSGEPEILQRITIESIDSGDKKNDSVSASIQVESFEGLKKKVDHFKFEKNNQGQMVRRDQDTVYVEPASGSFEQKKLLKSPTDDKIALELGALKLLMTDPAFMESRTDSAFIKLWTDQQGQIKLELIDKEPNQRDPLVLEKISISPLEMDLKTEKVAFKREKTEDGQVIKEKVELKPNTKPKVNLISINNLIISNMTETASKQKISGLEDQINKLGNTLQKAVKLSIANQNKPGFYINNQLSEFLYTIIPEKDMRSEKPIYLREYLSEENKVIERFEPFDEPGEIVENNRVPRQIGLVVQRFTILDYLKDSPQWTVLRESVGLRGKTDAIRFKQQKLAPYSILSKNQKPISPEDALTERVEKETRTVKFSNGVIKTCLDQFELPKINVNSLRRLISGKNPIPIIILQTLTGEELVIEKYKVPIIGICCVEMIDRFRLNLSQGKGNIYQHIDPSGGQIFEEFNENPNNPEDRELLNRVIVADVDNFNTTQQATNLKANTMIEPTDSIKILESGSFLKSSSLQPQDQKIIREKITDNETISEEIIMPSQIFYDVATPKCLDNYQLSVLERFYLSDEANPSLYPDCGISSKVLQEVGGIENLYFILSGQNTKSRKQDIFTLAGIEGDGVVIERVQVLNGEGGILKNIRLLERLRVKATSKYSTRLEDITAVRESFTTPKTVVTTNIKFSKTEGTLMTLGRIRKIITDSDLNSHELDKPQKPIFLKNFEIESQIGQFFKMLFTTHELLSKYLVIKTEKKGEYRKYQIENKAEGMASLSRESLILDTSLPATMHVQRIIIDNDNPIKEEITVTAKYPEQGSSVINNPFSVGSLYKTIIQFKKKVKKMKLSIGMKVQTDRITEDLLDCFLKRKLPKDLEDILNLVFKNNAGDFNPLKRYIKHYSYTQDKCVLSIFEMDPLNTSQIDSSRTIDTYNPVLFKIAIINKTPGVREFVELFKETIENKKIVESQNLKADDSHKSEYKEIVQYTIYRSRSMVKVQNYEFSFEGNNEILASLVQTQEKEYMLTADDPVLNQKKNQQHLSLIGSLFNSPELIMRTNCILVEHIMGDKKTVDRVDLLKVPDGEGMTMTAFLREKILLFKSLVDEIGSKPSLGESLDNFASMTGENSDQKMIVRRSRIERGDVLNETIQVSTQDKQLKTVLLERLSSEGRVLDKSNAIKIEKIDDNTALAMKYYNSKLDSNGNHTKSLSIIEPGVHDTTISKLSVRFNEKPEVTNPLAYSISDYRLNKDENFRVDTSEFKFNFLIGAVESVKVIHEVPVGGGKYKFDSLAVKSDLSEDLIETSTKPVFATWETGITIFGLCRLFERARDLSKEGYFLMRTTEPGFVIYELGKFTTTDPTNSFLITEKVKIEQQKDPFIPSSVNRASFNFSEDDLFEKMMVNKRKESEPKPKQQKSNQGGLFESLTVNDQGLLEKIEDSENDFEELENEGIVERKNVKSLGSVLDSMHDQPKSQRHIGTPIISAIKAIEDLKLTAEDKKDTILMQRTESNQTIIELVKVKSATNESPTIFEPMVRIIAPLEKSLFKDIEIKRETFVPNSSNMEKVVETLRISPEMELQKISTNKESQERPPKFSGVSLTDILLHLTKYLDVMKRLPYFVNLLQDTNDEIATEVVEIVDPFKEIPKERIKMRRRGKPVHDGTSFEGIRSTISDDGSETIQQIDYIKKPDGVLVSIKDTKVQEKKPEKPFKRNDIEKLKAEEAGIQTSYPIKTIGIEQVIDMMIKETDPVDSKEYLVRQKIDNGNKVIEKYEVNPFGEGSGLKLVERFVLGNEGNPLQASVAGKPGELSIVNLSQYLLKSEKRPDGSVVIRVLEMVPESSKNTTRSIMSKPITEEERKKWSIIVSGANEHQGEENIQQVVPPSFYLEIKEVVIDKQRKIQSEKKPLGDVVGYTLDGKPIFNRQMKGFETQPTPESDNNIYESADVHNIDKPEVQHINIRPNPPDQEKSFEKDRGGNMFDSVMEDDPQSQRAKNSQDAAGLVPGVSFDEIERIKELLGVTGDDDQDITEKIQNLLETLHDLDEQNRVKFKNSISIAPLETTNDKEGRIKELENECKELIRLKDSLKSDLDKAEAEAKKSKTKADRLELDLKGIQSVFDRSIQPGDQEGLLIKDLRNELEVLRRRYDDDELHWKQQNDHLLDDSAKMLLKIQKMGEENKKSTKDKEEIEKLRDLVSKEQQKLKTSVDEVGALKKRLNSINAELTATRDNIERLELDKQRLLNIPKNDRNYNPLNERIKELEEKERLIKGDLLKSINRLIGIECLGEEEREARTIDDMVRAITRGINNSVDNIESLTKDKKRVQEALKSTENNNSKIIEKLKDENSTLSFDGNQMRDLISDLEKKAKASEEKIERLSKENISLKSDSGAKSALRMKDDELRDMSQKLETQRREIKGLKDIIDDLETKFLLPNQSNALSNRPSVSRPEMLEDPLISSDLNIACEKLKDVSLLGPKSASPEQKVVVSTEKLTSLINSIPITLEELDKMFARTQALEREVKSKDLKLAAFEGKPSAERDLMNQVDDLNNALRQRENKINNLLQLQDLPKEINEMRKIIENLNKDVREKNQQNNHQQAQIENMRDELKNEKDKTNKLETRIIELTSAINQAPNSKPADQSDPMLDIDIDKIIKYLEDKTIIEPQAYESKRVPVQADKVKNISKTVGQLIEEKDRLAKDLKRAKEQADESSEKDGRQIENQTKNIETLKDRLTKTQSESDEAKRAVGDLLRKVDELTHNIESLRGDTTRDTQLKMKENEIAGLRRDLGNVREELKAEKDKSNQLDLRILEFASAINMPVKQKSLEEESNPVLDADIDKAIRLLEERKLVDPKEYDVRRVPVQAEMVQVVANSLNKAIEERDRSEKDLRETRENILVEKDRTSRQIDNLNKELENGKEKIGKLQGDLEEARKAKSDIQTINVNLQKELESLSQDKTIDSLLKSKDNEINALNKQMGSLRDELKNTKDDLAKGDIKLLQSNEEKEMVKKEKQRLESLLNQKPTDIFPEEVSKLLRIIQEKNLLDKSAQKKYPDHEYKQNLDSILITVPKIIENLEKKNKEMDYLSQDLGDLSEKLSTLHNQNQKDSELNSKKLGEKEQEIKALKAEKINQIEELERLRTDIMNLKENKRGDNVLRQKESEIGELKSSVEALRQDNKDLKDKMSAQQLEITNLSQELGNTKAEKSKINYQNIDPKLLAECERQIGLLTGRNIVDQGYVITMSTSSSMVCPPQITPTLSKGIGILLSQIDQSKDQLNSLKSDLTNISEETGRKILQLESKLRDEKEKADKEKENHEREIRESKKREAELERKLSSSVDKNLMQDKVGKQVAELDDKRNTIILLEKEILSLKNEVVIKEESSRSLQSELTDKSSKLIALEGLKNKIQELEDEKKRMDAKFAKEREGLFEEGKNMRIEAQKQKLATEMAQSRVKDLERDLAKLREELLERKKPGENTDFNDTIRSQSNLISVLKDKESKVESEVKRLARENENLTKEIDNLKVEINHKGKMEAELTNQVKEMYEQLDEINTDIKEKQRETMEANREADIWKDKFNRFKNSIESDHDVEDFQKKLRMAQLENDLERFKRTEAENLSRMNDIQTDLKGEKSRRQAAEGDVESFRIDNKNLVMDINSLKNMNKQLLDKNAELTQKLLQIKSDVTMDNKYFDLEDEMVKLKRENDDLVNKVRDLNDDIKTTNVRERSVSKENVELKNKIRSDRMMLLKQSETAQKEQHEKEREMDKLRSQRILESSVSPIKDSQMQLDYGPVFDLKLKNMALQQEINLLRNKLSEFELREKREQSMINFLKTQEMREMKDGRLKEISPIAYEKGGEERESMLDEMDISLRGSPAKKFGEENELLKECMYLRDELQRVVVENENLRNSISLLRSELINVAHNRVPPEMTSPNMIMKVDQSLNLSREVVDLARNVKRESDAIVELNRSMNRRERLDSSGKKRGIPSSSLERESFNDIKQQNKKLIKHVQDLEAKIHKYEETMMDNNKKLNKKDIKVELN